MNYFEAKLAHETDAADVAYALRDGSADFALVDARSRASYDRGHLPGAIHLAEALPDGPLVVYCWGPGCNAATKACARLMAEGRDVKEMIGGFEYWVREGHATEGANRSDLVGAVA